MKTLKKVLGYTLAIFTIPLIFGLMSLDGSLSYYGHDYIVVPFWGGFELGCILIGVAIGFLLIAWFIMYLIMSE